jgi:23S rRNA (cytidine2498-2'-O)-methyltransferase
LNFFLTEPGDEPFLLDELRRAFPDAGHQTLGAGLVRTDAVLQPSAMPTMAFARQLLPLSEALNAVSIREWSERLFEAVGARVPEGQPWRLHIAPHYEAANTISRSPSPRPAPLLRGKERESERGAANGAGENRVQFIRDAFQELLRKKRRHLLRALETDETPFTGHTTLVQLLLTAPDTGLLSVALAPLPWQLRRCVSPFAKGELPVASDKAAPSRAFTKLVEAEQRLGLRIAAGETCVDLGACPGSWSYVALNRGARVTAVDRSPLRADLMANPHLTFHQGDAFKFTPDAPVDWLLCDVIAAPERSVELVLDWVRQRRCRRFVVTIKFKGHADYAQLEPLKHALPGLCEDFFLARLCANKNEACVAGTVR